MEVLQPSLTVAIAWRSLEQIWRMFHELLSYRVTKDFSSLISLKPQVPQMRSVSVPSA